MNYLHVMQKFAKGGEAPSEAQAFLLDIMQNGQKYLQAGISEEFINGLAQTVQQAPDQLEGFLQQNAEELQAAMSVFKGGSVTMQKLGGKADYLAHLKDGSATPKCKTCQNGGNTPANPFVAKMKAYEPIIKSNQTIKYAADMSNGVDSGNGFAMIINNPGTAAADTVYRNAYVNSMPNEPIRIQTDNAIENPAIIEALKQIFKLPNKK